ncbi:hypothetical protein AO269_19985 [Pseudomonas putida]|nr:hypothetical protein AO269_19985 [Pseudomonas putida]
MVPSDFKPVMDAVATKGPGTYAINDQFEYNAFRFIQMHMMQTIATERTCRKSSRISLDFWAIDLDTITI